ncbi:MAG: acyl-CoA dehydrogenase family protein [Candidatus Binatia bacterium]
MSYLDLDLQLTDRERDIRDSSHRFAAEVLRPASLALDPLPPEEVIAPASPLWGVFRQAYRLGFHLQGLPVEMGGQGLTPRERHLVAEEMGWGSADFAIAVGVAGFPFVFAALAGNQELIDRYVKPFLEDKEARMVGCWAVTEPDHGSDNLLVGTPEFSDPSIQPQVRARRHGDGWIINGQKSSWVSNGTIATHALTFLSLDPSRGMAGGGVAFVPLDLPGVSKGRPLNKLGQRALNQGEIFFDDVYLPRSHMLMEPDGYETIADGILAGANAAMAATFTGVARAAFEEALAYSKVRIQGGKPLCEHQLIEAKLFDMFTRVEAARALSRAAFVYNAQTMPPATEYSIAAKVFCTEAAFHVASAAVQIHGGYGLSKEYVVEKLFRDARAALIEDGTNEVLGLAAARMLTRRYGCR